MVGKGDIRGFKVWDIKQTWAKRKSCAIVLHLSSAVQSHNFYNMYYSETEWLDKGYNSS